MSKQSTSANEIPVIYCLSISKNYVAALSTNATGLGLRKGMSVDLVMYFCWDPRLVLVDDINDIPKEFLILNG